MKGTRGMGVKHISRVNDCSCRPRDNVPLTLLCDYLDLMRVWKCDTVGPHVFSYHRHRPEEAKLVAIGAYICNVAL